MIIARPAIRRAHIEMVPLIDSFFLLLAFFVSSVLSMSVIGGLPVELPRGAHAVKLEPRDMAVVTITRDGQLSLNAQPLSLTQLFEHLKADPRASSLRVAVKTDRAVPSGQLLEVLDVVRGAGVRQVGLVTTMVQEMEPSPGKPVGG